MGALSVKIQKLENACLALLFLFSFNVHFTNILLLPSALVQHGEVLTAALVD